MNMSLAEAIQDAALQRRLRGLDPIAAPGPEVSTPSPLPVFAVTIHDVAACKRLDPITPETIPLWASPAVPLAVLGEGGAPLFTLSPVDAGTEIEGDLSIRAYELVVDAHGTDDTGETSEAWTTAGAAAMRQALEGIEALSRNLNAWQGRHETRLRQVEAVGRWYGCSPEIVESITGRPYVARRSLLPTCGQARTLDERKATREAEERAALARTEAARLDALRPKTIRQRHADGVAVRLDRIASNEFGDDHAAAPFANALETYRTETEIFFLWRRVDGFDLPPFEHLGARSVREDELTPPTIRPLQNMTPACFTFTRATRARFKTYDLGPVPCDAFVEPDAAKLETARQICAEHAKDIVHPMHAPFWASLVAQQLVRGLLIEPVTATVIIYRHLDAVARKDQDWKDIARIGYGGSTENWKAYHRTGQLLGSPDGVEPIRHLPSEDLRKMGGGFVGELCIAAAASGVISVGALLSPTFTSNITATTQATNEVAIQKDE